MVNQKSDLPPTLYIVIPCYNEEDVLPETAKRITQKLFNLFDKDKISDESKIVFVDDGSKDSTWQIISSLHNDNPSIKGLRLSRNYGHQNAVLAGLLTFKEQADIIITLDADLQDDINAIDKFIEKYHHGCDIVYGVRSSRKHDKFLKKFTAQSFYKFLNFIGVEIIYNHADYRLMSKRAIRELENFREVNLFLRGIVPLIGFKSDTVLYERHERFAGTSKYPLKRMLNLAWDGITSFSIKPIRIVSACGLIVFTASIIMLIYFIILHFLGHTVTGWTSIVVSVWAMGGLQLLATGIVGEYIGKIYMETKNRPKFIIDKLLD